MSIQTSSGNAPRIEELKTYLTTEGYTAEVKERRLGIARHFFAYLECRDLPIESVSAADEEEFVKWDLKNFRNRHEREPRDFHQWRGLHRVTVRIVMRLAQRKWPVVSGPTTSLEVYHRALVQGYEAWMRDLRGLSVQTRSMRTTQALQFLTSLADRGNQKDIRTLTVHDTDGYLQKQCAGLSRRSIYSYASCLRVFLRYLHSSGHTFSDLSGTVLGPRLYEHEHIPSALRPEDIKRVLQVTRRDDSLSGRRDYALMMLLATYGLRRSELLALRLEDINWRSEVLRVRHSKNGEYSDLPLLKEPGEAVLRYLQARVKNAHREIFLRIPAPHRPLKSLNTMLADRLKAAGVVPLGKKGAHAFRHARAVSMLRRTVPLKTIGDVLGHKSPHSTAVYLKLAMEDLRSVGLELPEGVSS